VRVEDVDVACLRRLTYDRDRHARSVGSPGWVPHVIVCFGELLEVAPIAANLPYLVCPAPIREIGDPVAVRRPAWNPINDGRLTRQLPEASPVGAHDVDVFFRRARIESYPLAVGRGIRIRPRSRSCR